ncbi:MAG TPA: hypothetical protein VNT30_02965 [Stellaceae bacterium]|nr:hypothetical protein [Stellaceae bacterium]
MIGGSGEQFDRLRRIDRHLVAAKIERTQLDLGIAIPCRRIGLDIGKILEFAGKYIFRLQSSRQDRENADHSPE